MGILGETDQSRKGTRMKTRRWKGPQHRSRSSKVPRELYHIIFLKSWPSFYNIRVKTISCQHSTNKIFKIIKYQCKKNRKMLEYLHLNTLILSSGFDFYLEDSQVKSSLSFLPVLFSRVIISLCFLFFAAMHDMIVVIVITQIC